VFTKKLTPQEKQQENDFLNLKRRATNAGKKKDNGPAQKKIHKKIDPTTHQRPVKRGEKMRCIKGRTSHYNGSAPLRLKPVKPTAGTQAR